MARTGFEPATSFLLDEFKAAATWVLSSGFVHFEVSRFSIPAFSLENICFDLAGVETLGLSIFELPVRQGMIQIGLVHLLSGEDEIS